MGMILGTHYRSSLMTICRSLPHSWDLLQGQGEPAAVMLVRRYKDLYIPESIVEHLSLTSLPPSRRLSWHTKSDTGNQTQRWWCRRTALDFALRQLLCNKWPLKSRFDCLNRSPRKLGTWLVSSPLKVDLCRRFLAVLFGLDICKCSPQKVDWSLAFDWGRHFVNSCPCLLPPSGLPIEMCWWVYVGCVLHSLITFVFEDPHFERVDRPLSSQEVELLISEEHVEEERTFDRTSWYSSPNLIRNPVDEILTTKLGDFSLDEIILHVF